MAPSAEEEKVLGAGDDFTANELLHAPNLLKHKSFTPAPAKRHHAKSYNDERGIGIGVSKRPFILGVSIYMRFLILY